MAGQGGLAVASWARAAGLGVETEEDGRRGESGAQGRGGEDHGRGGVLAHGCQSVRGVLGVEGTVGPPGLEDPQEGDDKVGGAVQGDAHQGVGADAEGPQAMSQLVSAGIERGIGQCLAVAGEGDGVGGPRDLRLEQGMNAGVPGVGRRRRVPGDQELVPLGVRQEREFANRAVRRGHDAFQEGLIVPEQPANRGPVEEVSVVLEIGR